MRAFSRDVKSSYYKYQSMPRNFTQQKRLQQLNALKENQVRVGIYKYSNSDQLGKGYSSKVYKGVQIENVHKRYAIKVIELKKFRGSNLEMLEAQIQIHRGLIHQNIVRLFQVIKTPYFYYIILQYCPHGNLHEYIRQKKKLSESNAIEIMEQVLAGGRYLMEQGVIHRDMKPANILRVGNKWKISDFGFSVKSKYGFRDRINMGTPLYMSPQSLKKSYYSAKTDIYSLGIILYEMVQGTTPYESRNQKELLQKMKEQFKVPAHIRNPRIREFLQKCCELNQAKRMSRQELLQFQMRANVLSVGSEKDSILGSSFSRVVAVSRRVSILSDQLRTQQEFLRHQIETLYNQFLFAKHLYSCIKNIDSFLIDKQGKQHFILTLFKLLLKLVRFLCDKKKNHFDFKHWQELVASKSYNQLYQKMLDQSQIFEKEYLQQIKNKDIKIIRSVNRKFPDLCNNNQISDRFYYDLHHYLMGLIREHNHELMIAYILSQQNKQNNGLKRDEQNKQQKSGVFAVQKVQSKQKENIQTLQHQNGIQHEIKPQLSQYKDQFNIQNGQHTTVLVEHKKQSRLLIKRLSRMSKASQSKTQVKSASRIQDPVNIKTNKVNITLNDKYQALQSLYTIYRICEMRCGNDDNKEMAIQKIKVVQNYLESHLEGKAYLDLRRLLRSI